MKLVINNYLLPGPHNIFKVTGQRSSQAATAWKSCELDEFGTADEISTKTYTNTSYSQATN